MTDPHNAEALAGADIFTGKGDWNVPELEDTEPFGSKISLPPTAVLGDEGALVSSSSVEPAPGHIRLDDK